MVTGVRCAKLEVHPPLVGILHARRTEKPFGQRSRDPFCRHRRRPAVGGRSGGERARARIGQVQQWRLEPMRGDRRLPRLPSAEQGRVSPVRIRWRRQASRIAGGAAPAENAMNAKAGRRPAGMRSAAVRGRPLWSRIGTRRSGGAVERSCVPPVAVPGTMSSHPTTAAHPASALGEAAAAPPAAVVSRSRRD